MPLMKKRLVLCALLAMTITAVIKFEGDAGSASDLQFIGHGQSGLLVAFAFFDPGP